MNDQPKENTGQRQNGDCALQSLCYGGCPHERMVDGRQAIDGHNVYCTCREEPGGGYPAIFAHMKSRSEELILRHV